MLRVFSIRRLFTQFYHPHTLKVDPSTMQSQTGKMHSYVSTYRDHGHHYAKLDPLELYNKYLQSLNFRTDDEFVRPTDFGIKFQDQVDSFTCKKSPVIERSSNVEQLENNLRKVYLSNTGVQFSHVTSLEEKDWLYENYQKVMLEEVPSEKRIQLAKILVEAQSLDLFLHKKFVTFKRYSGEGAESTIVALNQIFDKSSRQGIQHIVFGMPHRGRLNLLTNILQYQPRNLFRKISGKTDTPKELYTVVDDVTSHVAQSIVKKYNDKDVKITMVHNPSHLEAQNPVSMGKARSKQHFYGNDKVLNIQVHGDSAICGQGVVYESFLLGRVPRFDIGGTIHIITNNQLGYTTRPIDSRASKYCSDIGKAFDTPIIHCNSENIEDVFKVMNFCVEYKKKWKKDILVDLICYRKYGHNEVDEPEFTQPKMYHKIRKQHESNAKKYPQLLHKEGLVSENFYKETKQKLDKYLEEEFQASRKMGDLTLKDFTDPKSKGPRAFTEQWSKFKPSLYGQQFETGFDAKLLKEFAQTSVSVPANFTVHPRIKKYHIDERIKSLQTNQLNWATCESMALFSLNYEGYNIRLTGQDVERGTFSQRHINLVDQKTEETFNALEEFAKLQPGRGEVQIYNSPLSENAVLSYEYGYSLDHPHNMAIWEAQFGDFFNTAQVAIDTFLTNSENKWLRQNALTLILPHGYDGAGPEHSSCRIERFLQLANSDGKFPYKKLSTDKSKPLSIDSNEFWQDIQTANFSFVFPTKPSNMFHVLRRQMKRDFRKPLVIAGPKGLLRHNKCFSKLEDMGPGTKFERIWSHRNVQRIQECEVVLLCSGKFVYDIDEILEKEKKDKTALLTIEQLFPFPEAELKQILSKCSANTKVYWVQEENSNSGAFEFVNPRISRVLNQLKLGELTYVGRRAIATCAVGSGEYHKKEAMELAEWIKKISQ